MAELENLAKLDEDLAEPDGDTKKKPSRTRMATRKIEKALGEESALHENCRRCPENARSPDPKSGERSGAEKARKAKAPRTTSHD
jgi:hypothetical protein